MSAIDAQQMLAQIASIQASIQAQTAAYGISAPAHHQEAPNTSGGFLADTGVGFDYPQGGGDTGGGFAADTGGGFDYPQGGGNTGGDYPQGGGYAPEAAAAAWGAPPAPSAASAAFVAANFTSEWPWAPPPLQTWAAPPQQPPHPAGGSNIWGPLA